MAADSDNKGLRDLPIAQIVRRAYERRVLVPAFNIPYLPQVEPLARTLKELDCFALLEVARPDIERFEAESYAAVAWEYERHADPSYLRLHQDHVPVIDEERREVDWRPLIQEALDLGYDSVMLDGSRLSLDDNIAVTRSVVEMAHPKAAVEAELGAVLGHEPGPLPPYEELFRSGRGFTDVGEAERFVRETGVDWLSVAVGNVHGAISGAAKDREKVQARLNVEHLRNISGRVGVPLVLHGGTGIELSCVLEAVENGITKINIATAIRQAYEARLWEGASVATAQQAVSEVVAQHVEDYRIAGSATRLAAL
jgi:fructose/tagatose bisphosphate aldolase